MADFLYTAWLRDGSLQPGDEDYEWPCCFVVAADTEAEALGWGDRLAAGYCSRCPPATLLRSHAEPTDPASLGPLPRVAAGEEVPDEVIGW